jgi:hypothetical protein
MAPGDAIATAGTAGLGVGFVFTAGDPFFFLDIDHAVEGGSWTPTALGLFSRFAGCAVELSQSGAGAHIFGVGSVDPAAKKKNAAAGLELYTSGRFVALTGRGLIGDAMTDAQTALDQTVAEFFAPALPAVAGVLQTSGPDPAWRGPADDGELIRRMTARASASAIFGSGASASDLWTANAEALGRAYPTTDGRPWDGSSADLALLCHLAFWTGRDAERMERIFGQSALVREKWTSRADYRERSIRQACAMTSRVLGDQGAPPAPPAPAAATGRPAPAHLEATAEIINRSGAQILTVPDQVEYFRGCVYIRDAHRIYTRDGALLRPEQFRAAFGGWTFVCDGLNDRTTRNAWEAFTENQGAFFPRAHNLCFRPERPSGEIIREEGRSLVNVYTPIETARAKGDPAPFLDHLARILPDARDRQILISYMAAMTQFPGVKFQWAPLLQGMEGNGKSLIIRIMAEAIGHRYTHLPNAADIHNKFNAWIEGRLFIGVEEIYTPERQEALESLKPLITNERVEVQGKGLDQRTGDNRANFILCSNHKDAVRKTATDRRYCVFYTAQQIPEDMARAGLVGDYFPRLYRWLREGGFAIVNEYLRTYQIPPMFNPADAAHRAPETSSTTEAIAVSLGGVEQEVLEAIAEDRVGFRGGWVSSIQLAALLDARHHGPRRLSHAKRREMLGSIGYKVHPGLPGGRASIEIPAERGRPTLYVKSGSAEALLGQMEAIRAYQIAQGYPTI